MTKKERDGLDFIVAQVKKLGYPPTSREIQAKFGWKSQSSAMQLLNQLQRLGKITAMAGARAYSVIQ